MGQCLTLADEGSLKWEEQDEDGLTYAEKITAEDRRIDPSKPAREVHDLVRALTPHIGAWLPMDGDERLGIKSTTVLDSGPAAGAFADVDGKPVLGCGEGALRLDRVQPPGKNEMDGDAWMRGNGLP